MKKIVKTLLLLAVFFLSIPVWFNPTWAGFLKFDKTTVTVGNGETFQLVVTVDPGSDALDAAETYVTFDSTILNATAVTSGSLFPTVSHDVSTAGKVYITGYVNDPANSITAGGTLATITFQALKDGSATVSFDCASSKIIKNDINASNVISCSQNGSAAVTVGSGGGTNNQGNPNPTAIPATNTGAANNPQLPQSGVFENVVKFAIPGMVLLLLGGVLKLVF